MISFTSVYDLVSDSYIVSSPLYLETKFLKVVETIKKRIELLKQEGIDRSIIKTEKKELVYSIIFDNKILRGNRSTKTSASHFNSFKSPNFYPLGYFNLRITIHW